jgi:hypothetical protein
MCNVLRKTAVEDLLKENKIPYKAITAYVVGTDKLSKWTFDEEMRRKENFFSKNLEQKLETFFHDRGIEIPKNAYVDDERRGKTGNRSVGNVENNSSPKICDRLTELGWKKSFLMYWFGNSTGKLYNIIKQHRALVDISEWNLVAYFARCKPTALVYGGGQNGLFNDTEFVESIYIPCEYTAKKEFFEKLDDDEISNFLKNIGLPCHFFNEMLEGRLRVPESAAVKIAKYFKKDDVEFIFDYKGSNDNDKESDKSTKPTSVTLPPSVTLQEASKIMEQKMNNPAPLGNYHPMGDKSIYEKNRENSERFFGKPDPVKMIANILESNYRDISIDDLMKLSKLCKSYSKVRRGLEEIKKDQKKS